ncbi:MAG: SCO family protein [Proteobacteria bacterium]|nr:SCO family protein [Pseudomonadota bacterium]
MQLSGRRKQALIAFAVFDLLLLVILVSLFLVRSERESLAQLRELGVTVYPEARQLDEFKLTDQYGNLFSNHELLGFWTLVFFGFTSCPDICPITMAELKQFYEGLDDPAIKDNLRIVMVTVDPARDNPEAMGAYVNSFNQDFIGLSGDYESISALASQFFVAHSEPPTPSHIELEADAASNYLIEHSGHLAVVNPEGQYYAVMRSPHRDQELALAYRIIRGN